MDPPDEKQGRRPDVIQWWMSGEHQLPPPWIPMEERMIHRYFSEQDAFFDWTSKNGLLLEQSKTNRALFDIAHDRHAFEDRLRQGNGVEFMITGEPQPATGAPEGTRHGIWNIRKQVREKRRDHNGRSNDGLETIGTYYIVGENVYQAPSVADVVGNRLLAVSANLGKFYEKATSLSEWTPTTGRTYLPFATNMSKTGGISASTGPSPAHSREGSVMPGASGATDSQFLRVSSTTATDSMPTTNASSAASTKYQDSRLLLQSLQLAVQFNDDYMDENPLIGEPGHFSFASSTTAVKKRKADEEAAVLKAKEIREAMVTARAAASHQSAPIKLERTSSPPATMMEAKTGGAVTSKGDQKDRKSKLSEKAKRRKSRVNVLSPTTPGAATSPPPAPFP